MSLRGLADKLQQWSFKPGGTEGYRTAEVTLGGVSTDEVSSKSFEVKQVPGLYIIGEALDVTGWLGGFNFQWAWSSAACCAEHLEGRQLKYRQGRLSFWQFKIRQQQGKLLGGLKQPFTIVFLQWRLFENERNRRHLPKRNH